MTGTGSVSSTASGPAARGASRRVAPVLTRTRLAAAGTRSARSSIGRHASAATTLAPIAMIQTAV